MRPAEVVEALELRKVTAMSPDDQRRILAIRNQDDIRRNMYTSRVISADEHTAWLTMLGTNNTIDAFGVFLEGALIGLVSLNEISTAHKRASWAFYIDASVKGRGVGSCLEFKFLDYAFSTGIDKLNCEVFETNGSVIRLHEKFGFVREGVRRNHAVIGSEVIDVCLLGITRSEWEMRRQALKEGPFK